MARIPMVPGLTVKTKSHPPTAPALPIPLPKVLQCPLFGILAERLMPLTGLNTSF